MKDSIINIKCDYKEYRYVNNVWKLYANEVYQVNSMYLNNMLESSSYFTDLGGYMNIEQQRNRRFGLVISKVVSVSICGSIKKIFSFNYNQARVLL